jgi:hypothetical protein
MFLSRRDRIRVLGDEAELGSDFSKRDLAPFMIHELLPSVTETAFGCHPCRVVSITYRQLRPFHRGNTGSNPVGDAKQDKEVI